MKLQHINIIQTKTPKIGTGRIKRQECPTKTKTTINTIQTNNIPKNINKAQQPSNKSKSFSEKLIAGAEGTFKFCPSSFANSLKIFLEKNIQEKCSRRLAVMLNLKNGTTADFNDVCEVFYKDDAQLLKKYVTLLEKEGLAFEDMLSLKGGKRFMCVYGNRIHGADGNLYGDVVWFRDVSAEALQMLAAENEKNAVLDLMKQYENMIDGIDFPLWLRDENLRLKIINKKYVEYTGKASKEEVLQQNTEINNNKGEALAKTLAQSAQKTRQLQSQ